MNVKGFLTVSLVLLLGLFGQVSLAAEVEAEPQVEVVTSDGTIVMFISPPQANLVRLYLGESYVVTPGSCEYRKLSWLYLQSICQSAEKIKATETGLIHSLPDISFPQEVLRLDMMAAMVSIFLMLVAIVLMWGVRASKAFEIATVIAIATMATMATIATVIGNIAAIGNITGTLYSSPAITAITVTLATFAIFAAISSLSPNSSRRFYMMAGIHLVLMTVSLFLMW